MLFYLPVITFCSSNDWFRQIRISVLPSGEEIHFSLERFILSFTWTPTFHSEKSDFLWLWLSSRICDKTIPRLSSGHLSLFLTDSEVMELLLPAFLVIQVLGSVGGYPSGAPTGACEDMLPRHTGVVPQSSPAPYSLLTNSRTFQPGKAITGSMSTIASAPLCLNVPSLNWVQCYRSFLMLSCNPSFLCHAVTISGPEYRGVLLEARTAGSTDALGSWGLPPPDTKLLQVRPEQSDGWIFGSVSCWNRCSFCSSWLFSWVYWWIHW